MGGSADHTRAIVLRTRPVRESDLVVILLTPTLGKVDAIARGARRSRRRFPGGLAVGARGEAALARGRGSLMQLVGFQPRADQGATGRDLDRFAYVAYLCELCDVMVSGTSPDDELFDHLERALVACAGVPRPVILRRFELTLLRALGLLPAMNECAVCGGPVVAAGEGATGSAFDIRRGGVLCGEHATGTGPLDRPLLEAAKVLLEHPSADALESLDKSQRRELRDLCIRLTAPHLGRPLRSLEFFASLSRADHPTRPDPDDERV